jgi:hypothetical protein
MQTSSAPSTYHLFTSSLFHLSTLTPFPPACVYTPCNPSFAQEHVMKYLRALAGLALLGAAVPALAVGSLADLSVYDRVSGRTLPVYASDGKWYVAGRTGSEYELRIRNNSDGDLLAVVSVDGVNVVTGETATPSQGGYVIPAWQTVTISGWRKSLSRVASFYFTDHGDSYASRTGRPDDVGVIGVAVFRRKTVPPIYLEEPPIRQDVPLSNRFRREAPESAQSAPGGAAADHDARASAPPPAEKSIGTGHGRNQASQARYVSFERESEAPSEVISIYYDTRANLAARGIIQQQARQPNAFPGRFTPDPPRRW